MAAERSFAKYLKIFGHEFNPDGLPLERSTGLYDDLGLDSFDAFRLMLFSEDIAGLILPPEEMPPLFTVGDAYDYYRALVASRDGDGADA